MFWNIQFTQYYEQTHEHVHIKIQTHTRKENIYKHIPVDRDGFSVKQMFLAC